VDGIRWSERQSVTTAWPKSPVAVIFTQLACELLNAPAERLIGGTHTAHEKRLSAALMSEWLIGKSG
jgi:hypothetical protein